MSSAVDKIDSVKVVPDLGMPTMKIKPSPFLLSIFFLLVDHQNL